MIPPSAGPQLLGRFLFLGAVLGADQVAGPQWMLAQPVVAGALGGLACGQPLLGLLIGTWCQLAWNGAAPVGSRPNPDTSGGTLAGVLAASVLLEGHGWLRAACAGIAVALLAGWGGTWPAFWNRRLNARWTGWVLAAPDDPQRWRRVEAAQRLGWLCTAAISGTWVLLAGVLGGALCGAALNALPDVGGRGGALWPLAWGLGLASAALAFGSGPRRDWAWAAGGAVVAVGCKLAGVY